MRRTDLQPNGLHPSEARTERLTVGVDLGELLFEATYLVGHLGLEALVLALLALACLAFCLMDAICGLPRLGPETAKEMSERLWHLGDVGLNDFCLLASPNIEHLFDGRVASAAEPFPDGNDRHLFLLILQLSDSLANLVFIDNCRPAPTRHNVIL